MAVAAIYDIHGNLPALEAVLADIEQEDVAQIVVGGDVVAGPMPLECLSLLQSLPVPAKFVRGNAESDVLRHLAGESISSLPPRVAEMARWVAQQLDAAAHTFIESWAMTQQLALPHWGEVLFCHASPRNNMDIFTAQTPAAKVAPLFADLTATLVVCGHTHMQYQRTIAGVQVVNAGSVGMPFDQTGAFWLLLNETVQLRRTDYDLETAAARIRATDYPNADDFAANNVLQTPAVADVLARLTAAEVDLRDAA